jgi:hypothetical protein
MADYYPLIARAVEGLSDRSPEVRRTVYARARAALIEQLHSLDPPLAEADIERERMSLDDAIERVEASYSPPPAKPPAPVRPPERPPERADSAVPALAQEEARPAGLPPAPYHLPETPPHDESFDAYLPEAAGDGGPAYDDAAYDAPAATARPRVDSLSPRVRTAAQGRAIMLGLALILVIGAIAVAAWLLRDTPEDMPNRPQVAEAPQQPGEASKFNERVGGGPPLPASPNAGQGQRADVAVAQRAVFYEEDPANPQAPKTRVGRVLWRLEGVNAGQGQPLETVVRGTIEIPESGMTMNLLMRRNLDPTLPASHTVELSFATPQSDPGRVVRDVGLLQFKNDGGERGTPVAGLPVPVKENIFLIGLSNLNSDVERNIDLLLHRNWIDLPIRMASGQRAIISFEKGVAGEQVFNDAFRQWQ